MDPTGLAAEEGGTGGTNWDYFILIGCLLVPTGPPPVPNVPNAVGNVPASPGGLGSLGFQQGEWDWMNGVLSDPGQWINRGAVRARFGVIGEIAYILLVEDIVENIGLVFGDEVPMYRRAIAIADILTEVSPGKWLKAVRKADDVYDVLKANRTGRQKRLKEIANDPKASSADRGWIRNEQRQIEQGNRDTVRNPPGKELAHERGREAAKGYGYEHSNLQDKDLHRLQHKYDDFGRANKERPVE